MSIDPNTPFARLTIPQMMLTGGFSGAWPQQREYLAALDLEVDAVERDGP
jgi:hypothetical protein